MQYKQKKYCRKSVLRLMMFTFVILRKLMKGIAFWIETNALQCGYKYSLCSLEFSSNKKDWHI